MDMAELSTEVRIGKILLLISIVLNVIGIVFVLAFGTAFTMMMPFLGGFIYALAAVTVVGTVLQYLAYRKVEQKETHDGGIYALVASFVPPLHLFALIAGILFLVSPEAKKK
jgi:hypothetical protein